MASMYLDRQGRICDALSATEVEIEHIGSTSVPGLAAKPIIDIVVTVHDVTSEEDYLDALVAVGYELRVRDPGHRMVRTPARDVHVHILERRDPAVDDTFCSATTYAPMQTTAPSTKTPNGLCSRKTGTT